MKVLTVSLLLAFGSAGARAGLIASLTFTTPNGTVGVTDSIPVFLTLSLDSSSDALTTDGSGMVTSGISAQDITNNLFNNLPPADNIDVNTDTLETDVNVAYGCSGNFTTGCSGPPYDLSFNYTPPELPGATNLDLEPGSSTDFLLLTFTPTGGVAPPGTYSFTYASVFVQVFDTNFYQTTGDPSSGPLHIADVPVASTTGTDPEALFTRNVVTPEPGTAALFLSLATIAGARRWKVLRG